MKLVHTCRRVAELLSQQLDEPLGWLDQLRLRAHLSMCGDCSQVEQQLSALKSASSALFAFEEHDDSRERSISSDSPNATEPD